MNVIERAWKSYRRHCVPKNASARQVKETRQAFYSGGAILFSTMTGQHFFDGFEENDIEPTDNDLAKMQGIQDEIDRFGAELDLEVLGIRRH